MAIEKAHVDIVGLDLHMIVIQVHVGKNIIDDTFPNGRVNVNITTFEDPTQFIKPNPIPHHLCMANYSMIKPLD